MQGIKNIIFDLGGVLWNIDYHKAIDEFEKLGIPKFDKDFFSQSQQHDLFDDLDTGKITGDAFVSEVKRIIGKDVNDKDILNAWNSMLLDFPHTRVQLLEKLSGKYRLFLLSNTNEIHIKVLAERKRQDPELQKLNKLFKKQYLSFEVGLRKPHKEIYEYVLNDADLNPEETFFIDDSEQHLTNAKAVGIRTKWLNLNEGETTEKFFENW